MNFVYKKNCPAGIKVEVFLSLLYRRTDVLYACKNGIQCYEIRFCVVCDDTSQSCFSGAGRSVENHGRKLIRRYRTAQKPSFSDYVILTYIFVKISGAHSCGERFSLQVRRKKVLVSHRRYMLRLSILISKGLSLGFSKSLYC